MDGGNKMTDSMNIYLPCGLISEGEAELRKMNRLGKIRYNAAARGHETTVNIIN